MAHPEDFPPSYDEATKRSPPPPNARPPHPCPPAPSPPFSNFTPAVPPATPPPMGPVPPMGAFMGPVPPMPAAPIPPQAVPTIYRGFSDDYRVYEAAPFVPPPKPKHNTGIIIFMVLFGILVMIGIIVISFKIARF